MESSLASMTYEAYWVCMFHVTPDCVGNVQNVKEDSQWENETAVRYHCLLDT